MHYKKNFVNENGEIVDYAIIDENNNVIEVFNIKKPNFINTFNKEGHANDLINKKKLKEKKKYIEEKEKYIKELKNKKLKDEELKNEEIKNELKNEEIKNELKNEEIKNKELKNKELLKLKTKNFLLNDSEVKNKIKKSNIKELTSKDIENVEIFDSLKEKILKIDLENKKMSKGQNV